MDSSPVRGHSTVCTGLPHAKHHRQHGGEGEESGLQEIVISTGYPGLTPGKRKADLVLAWCRKPQRAAAGLEQL